MKYGGSRSRGREERDGRGREVLSGISRYKQATGEERRKLTVTQKEEKVYVKKERGSGSELRGHKRRMTVKKKEEKKL